jgi:hypothetical protein
VRDLPAPLPPGERTIGQDIGEAIRAYGDNFWRALALGLPLAILNQFAIREPQGVQVLLYWAATPLFVAAYLFACTIVHNVRPTRVAVLAAVLVYLPFPVLRAFVILPGVAWFALIGLAVPAAMIEKTGFRDSLVRGRRLGTADYAHALGTLAVLVLVVGIGDNALTLALRSQGDSSERVALFMSDMILSPLLYLGGAMLYLDQAARVGSRASDRRRRRDADLHPPVDADAAGRADP